MARSIVATLALTAALLAGCGDTDPGAVPADESGSASPTPTPTADEWLTTIPADVHLPHDGLWEKAPYSDYTGICLGPPPELSNVHFTDARRRITSEDASASQETLAVYADGAAAAESLEDLRGEVEVCGHDRAEGSELMLTWRVLPDQLAGTDELMHVYLTWGSPPGAAPMDHLQGPFITLARVGNARFTLTEHPKGWLDDAEVARLRADGRSAVEAYLPVLCRFGANSNCD